MSEQPRLFRRGRPRLRAARSLALEAPQDLADLAGAALEHESARCAAALQAGEKDRLPRARSRGRRGEHPGFGIRADDQNRLAPERRLARTLGCRWKRTAKRRSPTETSSGAGSRRSSPSSRWPSKAEREGALVDEAEAAGIAVVPGGDDDVVRPVLALDVRRVRPLDDRRADPAGEVRPLQDCAPRRRSRRRGSSGRRSSSARVAPFAAARGGAPQLTTMRLPREPNSKERQPAWAFVADRDRRTAPVVGDDEGRSGFEALIPEWLALSGAEPKLCRRGRARSRRGRAGSRPCR